MSDFKFEPFTAATRKMRTLLIAWSAVGILLGTFGLSKTEIAALVTDDFGNAGYIMGAYAIVALYLLISFFIYQREDIIVFRFEIGSKVDTFFEKIKDAEESKNGANIHKDSAIAELKSLNEHLNLELKNQKNFINEEDKKGTEIDGELLAKASQISNIVKSIRNNISQCQERTEHYNRIINQSDMIILSHSRIQAVISNEKSLRMILEIYFPLAVGVLSIVVCATRAVYSFWPVAFEMVPPP